VNVSLAAKLYQEGLTLREVGAMVRRTPAAVLFALRKAGIPRRPNCNPAWVRDYPRVEVTCASCGRKFKRRQFHYLYGGGTRSKPNPPRERFCSSVCEAWGSRRRAAERASRTTVIEVTYR